MATVKHIFARPILGFRGTETIEVGMEDSEGNIAACKIPFGKSEGSYEAAYCSAREAQERARDVLTPLCKGKALGDQKGFDAAMIEKDGTAQKQALGGNLMLGASIAYARLSSREKNLELHEYIADLAKQTGGYRAPRILCNMVEGGVHAENALEFQEHLLIPRADSVRQGIGAIQQYAEAFFSELRKMGKALVFGDEGGWAGAWDREESLMRFMDSVRREAGIGADFGFDIAANNVSAFEPKSYLKRYLDLIAAYPIIFIEDPFPEEGYEPFYQDLYRAVGKTTLVVGDDLIVTNPARIKHFVGKHAINAIIVKPDQVGTLTETVAAAALARKNKWSIAVAHRAHETTDDYLADVAVGLRADFVKFGYLYQGERLAKYNRLLEIESGIQGA